MSSKTKKLAQKLAYVKNLLYLCSVKGKKQLNFETMFGVKSSNQPISGQFAEDFCRNLIEARKHSRKDARKMSHVIICD